MARYDYRCTACGTVFEVEHGMTERPQVTCPACGAPADKLFSTSGIVFEGSGFYNTDQRAATTAATGEQKPGGGHGHVPSNAASTPEPPRKEATAAPEKASSPNE